MTRIIRATTLAIVVGAAATQGAAYGTGTGQSPTGQKPGPTGQAKAREQPPGVSSQAVPTCSGRPDARCTKNKGVKKLRTIF